MARDFLNFCLSENVCISLSLSFFFFWPHDAACRISVPPPLWGLNLGPLQWKRGVPATPSFLKDISQCTKYKL